MIPAQPGWAAQYKHAGHDATPHYAFRPVVAWDERDGSPFVVNEGQDGRLVDASLWSNYAGVVRDPDQPIASVAPAGGWCIEVTAADGSTWSSPLVGWGVRADGQVVPLMTDLDGLVEECAPTAQCRVYHPDAAALPAPDAALMDVLQADEFTTDLIGDLAEQADHA